MAMFINKDYFSLAIIINKREGFQFDITVHNQKPQSNNEMIHEMIDLLAWSQT